MPPHRCNRSGWDKHIPKTIKLHLTDKEKAAIDQHRPDGCKRGEYIHQLLQSSTKNVSASVVANQVLASIREELATLHDEIHRLQVEHERLRTTLDNEFQQLHEQIEDSMPSPSLQAMSCEVSSGPTVESNPSGDRREFLKELDDLIASRKQQSA